MKKQPVITPRSLSQARAAPGRRPCFAGHFPKPSTSCWKTQTFRRGCEAIRARSWKSCARPVIFDEIQNVPVLFDYVRTLIDAKPRRMGQWLFTGSQEAPLMQGITESMAGRAAILQLLPFSLSETPR